jgi:hypothetical protein
VAVTISVQAAGHAGLLARLGERVDPIDQDRRRSVHSPAGCFLRVIDHAVVDGDIAAAFEHLRQALV